jgi:hypothetical protein
MGKRVEKKKKREFSFPGLGTRFLAHPGRERARGSAYGPAATHERGGDGAVREGDGVAAGPLASESGGGGGGENGVAARRHGEPAERGRRAGRRWPGSRSKGGGLARAEAGDSKGRLNSVRGGWEGAAHGEGAEFHGGDRRRWALGGGRGLGSGASGSWPHEGAARLT